MKEKIGVGIIGTGFARRVQIPALKKIAAARVVSVASHKILNAENAARDFGVPHSTGDWRETIDHADVDLVIISTPPNLHREMTLYAIEHGKHIVCEKPMAMNAAEAFEMLEAARGKNLLTVIDHELRFQTGRRRAFEMIRSGEIGKIRHVNHIFRAPQRGQVDLPWTWWHDVNQGGGNLGATISHIFDTLRWFLGTEISSVFCQLQTQVKKRREPVSGELRDVTSDDQANLLLRLYDGPMTEYTTANVSASMTDYPEYQNRVEFFGAKGAIRVDHRGDIYFGRASSNEWTAVNNELGEIIEGEADTGFSRGFINFSREVIEALLKGETQIEQAATFDDGYLIQLALDAARESDTGGVVVKL